MTPEDLVELEQIKRLKYRYARALDTKDWDELGGCFVEDATASYSGGQLSFDGRAAIMGFLRNVLGSEDVLTSHGMGQPEIELTGLDTARATWALHDIVLHVPSAVTIQGASFYEDSYVKVDGSWWIKHTGYRRVYEEVSPRAADAKLTATWFQDAGKSRLV